MKSTRLYPTRTTISPEEMAEKTETNLTERKWLDDLRRGRITWEPCHQSLWETTFLLSEVGGIQQDRGGSL